MLKGTLAVVALAILTMFGVPSVRHGARDLKNSWTRWSYFPIRDMRRSVALQPQKVVYRLPDDASVPTIGKEVELDRDVAAEKLHNPIPSSDASIARGDSLFHKLCVPCHGRSMAGDGPVAAQFMTPPDLLAQQTRERKDGFIYTYIRHGGVVMPSYGFQVSAEEAWHLVNFIRHQQKMSPR
ncbi:MAG: cytochrome c [Candidatus Eisenbacteria bacterium]|uniref:Cytochrome c n=1 Tax=Eiseniibacteriota bacterium TaxID=2212470 RepID=A0A538TZM9_UNCEI|nr:MAG: cytochrome c [Candidatus Eisenbacteria bacterium]